MDVQQGDLYAQVADFRRNPAHLNLVLNEENGVGIISVPFAFHAHVCLHGHIIVPQGYSLYVVNALYILQHGHIIVYEKLFARPYFYFLHVAPFHFGFPVHRGGNVGVQIAGYPTVDVRGGNKPSHGLIDLYPGEQYGLHFVPFAKFDFVVGVFRVDFERIFFGVKLFPFKEDVPFRHHLVRVRGKEDVTFPDVPGLVFGFKPLAKVLYVVTCHGPGLIDEQQQVVAVEFRA